MTESFLFLSLTEKKVCITDLQTHSTTKYANNIFYLEVISVLYWQKVSNFKTHTKGGYQWKMIVDECKIKQMTVQKSCKIFIKQQAFIYSLQGHLK